MTKDDIIRMAREAGFVSAEFWPENFQGLFGCAERFAALVAAAEREACAKVCDEAAHDWHQHAKGGPAAVYNACAAAIRARGQT